ncbi:MAG: ATP-binding protein [Candidatus Thermoplasmatota archaeon]|jgi:transitional endoplasmic reticulum ATPase|nr:ATP-binding protein [Candidatus Thermoplasmatota archaeon]MCL5790561.1 ATP-binding protein [Candidatus Thermoplasmatota archaeon]
MNPDEERRFVSEIQALVEEAMSMESSDPHGAATKYLEISRKILDGSSSMNPDQKKKFMKIADTSLNRRDEITRKMPVPNRAGDDRQPAAKVPAGQSQKIEKYGPGTEFIVDLHPEIYETTFDDIAGLDEVKDTIIRQVIKARERPDLARKYGITGRNIFLFGPPGTGKTSIAQAISHEISYPMVTVTPSYILDNRFGAFEKNIRSLFEESLTHAPIIIFFDEFESLAPRRSSINSSYMKRGVPEMLRQMTDLRKRNDGQVILIAATNNPWDVDEAMLNPERFDTRIFIPPPDQKSRSEIFRIFLKDLELSDGIDYEELGVISEGFSAADIKYVCRTAAEYAFSRAVDSGVASPISDVDIRKALESSHPSITDAQMRKYHDFMEKYIQKT